MTEKKIDKVAKLATNPHAQPDVRMREMRRLLDEGTPAALRGVLRRFAANASGAIADEDEKKYLEDAVVELGQDVVEPLRQYIRQEKQLTYALRAYQRICGDEEGKRYFIEVLNYLGPDDHRSLDAKLQLVWQLAETLDEDVIKELLPFLEDHSDDVRWAVIDLVERAADQSVASDEVLKQAGAQMGELVTTEEVSQRILKRVAQVLADRQWRLEGATEEDMNPTLEGEFFIDKKCYLRRRPKRN